MRLLRKFPTDPAPGANSESVKLEAPEPYIMVTAVRFGFANSVVVGNRIYQVLIRNQSTDEVGRGWFHNVSEPMVAGAAGVMMLSLNFPAGVVTTSGTPLTPGVALYYPLIKAVCESGVIIEISGPTDVGDTITSIQIQAVAGTLDELMMI